MSESITFHLHAKDDTAVVSSRFEVPGQGWCSTIQIGPVTIFAEVGLLRRLADEAMRAALMAEGWSAPAPTVPAPDMPAPAPRPALVDF